MPYRYQTLSFVIVCCILSLFAGNMSEVRWEEVETYTSKASFILEWNHHEVSEVEEVITFPWERFLRKLKGIQSFESISERGKVHFSLVLKDIPIPDLEHQIRSWYEWHKQNFPKDLRPPKFQKSQEVNDNYLLFVKWMPIALEREEIFFQKIRSIPNIDRIESFLGKEKEWVVEPNQTNIPRVFFQNYQELAHTVQGSTSGILQTAKGFYQGDTTDFLKTTLEESSLAQSVLELWKVRETVKNQRDWIRVNGQIVESLQIFPKGKLGWESLLQFVQEYVGSDFPWRLEYIPSIILLQNGLSIWFLQGLIFILVYVLLSGDKVRYSLSIFLSFVLVFPIFVYVSQTLGKGLVFDLYLVYPFWIMFSLCQKKISSFLSCGKDKPFFFLLWILLLGILILFDPLFPKEFVLVAVFVSVLTNHLSLWIRKLLPTQGFFAKIQKFVLEIFSTKPASTQSDSQKFDPKWTLLKVIGLSFSIGYLIFSFLGKDISNSNGLKQIGYLDFPPSLMLGEKIRIEKQVEEYFLSLQELEELVVKPGISRSYFHLKWKKKVKQSIWLRLPSEVATFTLAQGDSHKDRITLHFQNAEWFRLEAEAKKFSSFLHDFYPEIPIYYMFPFSEKSQEIKYQREYGDLFTIPEKKISLERKVNWNDRVIHKTVSNDTVTDIWLKTGNHKNPLLLDFSFADDSHLSLEGFYKQKPIVSPVQIHHKNGERSANLLLETNLSAFEDIWKHWEAIRSKSSIHAFWVSAETSTNYSKIFRYLLLFWIFLGVYIQGMPLFYFFGLLFVWELQDLLFGYDIRLWISFCLPLLFTNPSFPGKPLMVLGVYSLLLSLFFALDNRYIIISVLYLLWVSFLILYPKYLSK